MNSHKARCQWCHKIYASARAYSNHIQKSHPECLQSVTILVKRRHPDGSKALPDSLQDTTYKPNYEYFTNSDLYNYNLDRLELVRIYNTYADFEVVPEISEAVHDSDVEPFVEEANLSSSNGPNGNPYTSDVIRSLPNQYKAGQAVKDFPFAQQ